MAQRLPENMDKCVRHVGGTKVFFYACMNDGYWLLDPEARDLVTGVPESHFRKCYLPYSAALPPQILAMLDAMPGFREWRKRNG